MAAPISFYELPSHHLGVSMVGPSEVGAAGRTVITQPASTLTRRTPTLAAYLGAAERYDLRSCDNWELTFVHHILHGNGLVRRIRLGSSL